MNLGTINSSLQEPMQQLPRFERTASWIHEHPTTVKVLKVAGLILGVGLLASLPFTAPVLATGVVVILAITGVLSTLASSVALFALDIIFPPHHDMKNHVYKPKECEGGKIYYEGDVPVLSLETDDPYKAGKAHGYLCGEAIDRLTSRWDLVLHKLWRQPRANQLPNTLEKMRRVIPDEYMQEIEGLVEGYNQWSREQYFWRSPKKLKVDDVLLLHLLPEISHFQAGYFERGLEAAPNLREQAVACSAIVEGDPENGFVVARNMDWPSLGLAGAYSLVINRKHTNELRSTIQVGVPGFIGTLTGMNDQHLCVAMNVCLGETNEIRGMPSSLYNRWCLERFATAREVEDFTRTQSPLGPYHLTVADPRQAQSIHFYQARENTHLVRPCRESQPIYTVNLRYDRICQSNYADSAERQREIRKFFENRGGRPLEEALSLPFVNNSATTHCVVMEPKTGRFEVSFDNAFAGKTPLHNIPERLLH